MTFCKRQKLQGEKSDHGCLKVKVTQPCLTLCNPMDYTDHGILQAWIPTGVGSLFLLQGIFPTQGSNPGLPHCRWILYQLSYQGSPYGCLELDIRRGDLTHLWVMPFGIVLTSEVIQIFFIFKKKKIKTTLKTNQINPLNCISHVQHNQTEQSRE